MPTPTITWEHVPHLVALRSGQVGPVIQQLSPHVTEKVSAFWSPTDGHVRFVGDLHDCRRAAAAVPELDPEISDSATCDEFIRVKAAAALGVVGNAWTGANKAIGGPNPLTNAIVGGLATGALGYGAGALLEHLFPERYLERGKLRKTLGTIGATLGVAPAAWKGYAYSRNDGTSFLEGMTTSDSAPPAALTKLSQILADFPINARFEAAADAYGPEFVKFSYGGALDVPSVPVDAFNRAIWTDVRLGIAARNNPFGTKGEFGDNEQQLHTPPQLGAATAGLVSGIAAQTGTPILRPRDMIAGLASAGVGLATANIAGRTLSALAGLTPEAQQDLQRAGMWGGIIRHVVPPIFGYR